MILFFAYLAAQAVWNTTAQRPGTRDEVRILSAACQAVLIYAGAAWLL